LNENRPTELIVALDYPRPEKALELVKELKGFELIYKVGLELFLAGGPEFVRELVHQKNRVFLDLKLHDIPNTVARAARQAALLHVDMFTVHLSGGSAMVKAVAQEMADIPTLKPKILGVSVLTSFDDVRWAEVTRAMCGHTSMVADAVNGLVAEGVSWGADGVVCSALELPEIRKSFPSLYTVVPGIRPEGSDSGDQARVVTPAQAHVAGASAVVIGRPITESKDPRGVITRTLKDLGNHRISA
jgi:orotidine-5'-phosphate decarboxylase